MTVLAYTLGVLGLCLALTVFAYLDRVYRHLGRMSTGRVREHLEYFEANIEPRFKLERRQADLGFSILVNLTLAVVAVQTAHGVLLFVPRVLDATIEIGVYLLAEVLLFGQLIPAVLLGRTRARWVLLLTPSVRAALALTWPFRALLEMAISFAHISEEERPAGSGDQADGIEALVEAAQEEGILAQDEADLIEQVVEFSDKRVLTLMTPRPEIVAIADTATLEQMRRLLIETRFSRVVVYRHTLDDVVGIADAQDLLRISEEEARRRTAGELARPALFVPETKLGSQLLREMRRRNQPMAIVVDEHGLVAGVVTIEDLVEEIVGEVMQDETRTPPDVVRESDGSLTLRGSVSVEKLQELLGVEFARDEAETTATTVAGLLNRIAGHVPRSGERLDYHGLRFEVVEANQRKVLRLRVRRGAAVAPAS
jgi:CBS domain containing-hemolysin-like protein